jgi:ketosteroid isomerase-like protein
MTANKRTVEAYMEGFRRTDRPQILSCLTDDVEWVLPGAFHVFVGHPRRVPCERQNRMARF